MQWIKFDDQDKSKQPFSSQLVLVLKTYLDEYGWRDPFYQLDTGWYIASGFSWTKGGRALYWMPLPEMPIEKNDERKN